MANLKGTCSVRDGSQGITAMASKCEVAINNRDFKQGLRKCLVRRVLAAEKWNEYVESRQNSKLLCTLSKSRSTEVYNLSR